MHIGSDNGYIKEVVMKLTAIGLLLAFQMTPTYPQQPYPYTSGVVIKIDGGVIIDEWKFYDPMPGNVNPTKIYPTSVTLGRTLKNPVNVCVEFDNGSICKDIGELRALLESQRGVKK